MYCCCINTFHFFCAFAQYGQFALLLHTDDINQSIHPQGTVTAKTPSNRGDEIVESKSNFTVVKGEEAPKMGDCGPVTGVAKKQCNMTIPYKVLGVQI